VVNLGLRGDYELSDSAAIIYVRQIAEPTVAAQTHAECAGEQLGESGSDDEVGRADRRKSRGKCERDGKTIRQTNDTTTTSTLAFSHLSLQQKQTPLTCLEPLLD
jgi:hypothetical protein